MLRNILTLSALIVVVLLVRAVFRNRVPKRMLYALWLVVLLKLCLPGTLVSLPVLPAQEASAPVARTELSAQTTAPMQQPTQAITQPQESARLPVSQAQNMPKSEEKPLTSAQILQLIWICGSVLLGLWLFGAWLSFTLRLYKSRRFLGKHGRTRMYVSDAVKSPCLAGLFPAVYLTEDILQAEEAALILRHELTHLRHLDFIWSFCRTAAVVIYWWNPLVWLAAICSKRDAELACDEAVAAGLDQAQCHAYARAILAHAPRKKAALSLAGPPVKERILFLTKKRRTSALCVVLVLLLVVSATGCSFAELTQKEPGTITVPEEASADTASATQAEAQAAQAGQQAESGTQELSKPEVPAEQDTPRQQPDTVSADSDCTYDEIWSLVHEKLDSASWAQDMTPEYEEAVRAFQTADSKLSDTSGDISQWPHYYSAFVAYFSDANADRSYLDEDAVWTTDLSEDEKTLIVTMTLDDAALTLFYSLQAQTVSPSAIVPLTTYDADTPLSDSEFTLPHGLCFGMSYDEAYQLCSTSVSDAFTGEVGRSFTCEGYTYSFDDEDILFSVFIRSSADVDPAPTVRGICLGDSMESVFDKFPCTDRELKQWAMQVVYDDGAGHWAELAFVADSFYSLRLYTPEGYVASLTFARADNTVKYIDLYSPET